MADDDDGKEYRWETGYEKTWEAIKEDEDGLLEASVADLIQKAKRKRQSQKKGHSKLGMMRHLYLIIDCSEAMTNQDLKPTRQLCTIKLLEGFIEEFFDQNPISQLGLITTKNKRAEKLSELAGNSKKHIKLVQSLAKSSCSGEPSLQNSLELALRSLRLLPSHASREVLVLMASLTTCDPGDILDTIATLKKEGVRCSVIGLAAEVSVCSHLARETGGKYGLILDDTHYKDLLFEQIEPPAAAQCLDSALIKMGFPHHSLSEGREHPLTLCMCHLDVDDLPLPVPKGKNGMGSSKAATPKHNSRLSAQGYYCPQCSSKYCELPVECRACGLTLVSAPHLARSYHHLFPVDNFIEQEYAKVKESISELCFACQKAFTDLDKNVYKCKKCQKIFCLDCDLFIHDVMHICPGCAMNPQDSPLSL